LETNALKQIPGSPHVIGRDHFFAAIRLMLAFMASSTRIASTQMRIDGDDQKAGCGPPTAFRSSEDVHKERDQPRV
jgi:hypothetical protein